MQGACDLGITLIPFVGAYFKTVRAMKASGGEAAQKAWKEDFSRAFVRIFLKKHTKEVIEEGVEKTVKKSEKVARTALRRKITSQFNKDVKQELIKGTNPVATKASRFAKQWPDYWVKETTKNTLTTSGTSIRVIGWPLFMQLAIRMPAKFGALSAARGNTLAAAIDERYPSEMTSADCESTAPWITAEEAVEFIPFVGDWLKIGMPDPYQVSVCGPSTMEGGKRYIIHAHVEQVNLFAEEGGGLMLIRECFDACDDFMCLVTITPEETGT